MFWLKIKLREFDFYSFVMCKRDSMLRFEKVMACKNQKSCKVSNCWSRKYTKSTQRDLQI